MVVIHKDATKSFFYRTDAWLRSFIHTLCILISKVCEIFKSVYTCILSRNIFLNVIFDYDKVQTRVIHQNLEEKNLIYLEYFQISTNDRDIARNWYKLNFGYILYTCHKLDFRTFLTFQHIVAFSFEIHLLTPAHLKVELTRISEMGLKIS